MRHTLILAALALTLLGGAARADDCALPWADIVAQAAAHQATLVELDAARRAVATANYNAAPPASHDTFEHIWSAEVGARVAVFFVRGGCVITSDMFSPEGFMSLVTPAKPKAEMKYDPNAQPDA